MKKFKLQICLILCSCLCYTHLFAQQQDRSTELTKKITVAKTTQELGALFEELKGTYFKMHKYSDFAECLKSLGDKNKLALPFTYYYIALSRYQQLKYLEETQEWDEYFASGNTYRDEITGFSQKVIDITSAKDVLNLNARLLLFHFHKDQQDNFCDEALSGLFASALEYAKEASDIEAIKKVADGLLDYGEKGKAKELYKIYVEKLTQSAIKDEELEKVARNFYHAGNPDLAEALFDVYVGRIVKSTPKEKLIPILADLAKLFAYKNEGANDPLYAEKIFEKLSTIGGKEAFDENLMYLRANNLEKGKEYAQAKDNYAELLKNYPKTSHAAEANFKIAVISTYLLKEIDKGKDYLQVLAKSENIDAYTISSLYQLGLLSHWEADTAKAKEYYEALLAKAKDNFQEAVVLAKERLKEITENKPLGYNLQTFLDIVFKNEAKIAQVDLNASAYNLKSEEKIKINAKVFAGESGCMPVQLEYLWSGDLGTNLSSTNAGEFETAYKDKGTKLIFLLVVSPSDTLGWGLDIIDVY